MQLASSQAVDLVRVVLPDPTEASAVSCLCSPVLEASAMAPETPYRREGQGREEGSCGRPRWAPVGRSMLDVECVRRMRKQKKRVW